MKIALETYISDLKKEIKNQRYFHNFSWVDYIPHTDDSKEFEEYIYMNKRDRMKPSIKFRRDIEPLLNKISVPIGGIGNRNCESAARVAAVYN